MLGLEPGDVPAFAVRVLHFAEAQEGVHLADVAPDRFPHRLQPMNERVARHLQQVALAMQDAPDQPVEQGVALRLAVTDDALDERADSLPP
jgi:hypothetical protein